MESAHRYFRIGAPLILEWTHQSTGICNNCNNEKNEYLVLLNYMLNHNVSHVEEVKELLDKMDQDGYTEAVIEMRKCVEYFNIGNHHLSHAVEEVRRKLGKKNRVQYF